MVNTAGRILRIIVGLILISIGVFFTTATNWLLITIGIIPLAAGLFDFCLLAPLMGYYFSGKKTRAAVS